MVLRGWDEFVLDSERERGVGETEEREGSIHCSDVIRVD